MRWRRPLALCIITGQCVTTRSDLCLVVSAALGSAFVCQCEGELSVNCAARGGWGRRGIAVLIIDTRRLAPKMFHFNVVRSGDRRSSLAPSIRRPAPPLSSPSRCCHLSLPPLVDMCVCIYCLMTQRMHSMVVRTLRPITELYRRYLVISAIPLTFGEHLGS